MARDEAGCPMDTSCRREWQKGSDVVVRVELRVSTTRDLVIECVENKVARSTFTKR